MTTHNRSKLSQLDVARLRRWLLIVTAVLLWISSSATTKVNADDVVAEEIEVENHGPVVKKVVSASYVQHGITITPAPSTKVTINGLTYDEVYDSIPYHRDEVRANPGYRHDATMEVLFGEMRPTTNVRYIPQQGQIPSYSRPYGGYPYGSAYSPYGPYVSSYSLGRNLYGLSAYRWSTWDNFYYRRASFMFGVR